MSDRSSYADFPDGFFGRADELDDAEFYSFERLVTHIDPLAIGAVGALYDELGIDGDVLDLMSSWVSHFRTPPASLRLLGMNAAELEANPMATDWVVHDLNESPELPFPDASFDDVVCCVSVDYLIHPVEVFRDVARTLRPGGRFVCTFSNRCFPTKAIRGWLMLSEPERIELVAMYFARSRRFEPAHREIRRAPGPTDPLYAVWAERRSDLG